MIENDRKKYENIKKEIKKNNIEISQIQGLRKLYEKYPNNIDLKWELADLLILYNDTIEEGKEMLIELSKRDNYAFLILAKLEIERADHEKAIEYIEKIIDTKFKFRALLLLGQLKQAEKDYEKARECFEACVMFAPQREKDNALIYLSILEMQNGNINIARDYLNSLIYSRYCDELAIRHLILLEIREGNLQAAYDLYKKYSNAIKILDKKIITYLEHKLFNKYHPTLKNTYFFTQLFDFDEEKAIEHIKRHLNPDKEKKRFRTSYQINLNVDILYRDISLMIQDMKPEFVEFADKYVITYDYLIGNINGVDTDRIQVITFQGTKNIMTMYPIPKLIKSNDEYKTLSYKN